MSFPHWPLFDLVIRTPRLELRLPTDVELTDLVSLIDRGIHDPDRMPFSTAWTQAPSPQRERSALQFHWRQRADWAVKKWALPRQLALRLTRQIWETKTSLMFECTISGLDACIDMFSLAEPV